MTKLPLFILLLWIPYSFAFDWQGHRGARGLYPENTIGGMEEALKYPVTTLELDVVLSRDHKVVVSHEPWMHEEICLDPQGKKVKGREHNLYKLNYSDIVKYDCGSIPHPRFPEQAKVNVGKPLLGTLLDVTEALLRKLNRKQVEYNIEIKSDPDDEKQGFQPDIKTFADVVVATILDKIPASRFTIQSFDWRVLKYLHQKYPDIRLVALSENEIKPEDDLKELGFKPYVFSPYFKKLQQDDVKSFHEMGVKVIPWTVNEVEDMKKLKAMGVDGIITDYPNRITMALQKDCKKGFSFFEGKCVKVPAHALPSDSNPGWICKSGYVQKRGRCIKISIPAHAHLTPDGKSWECDEGYSRYRGTCKKSP